MDQPLEALKALLPSCQSSSQPPEGGRQAKRRRRRSAASAAGPRKRKLTAEQVSFLEINFGSEHKLESARKDRLAAALGLDPRQVAVWFQNRRARWRSKHLEEEYTRLKLSHETAVVDKCRLEAEVLSLRERLAKAEEEIRKLSAESEQRSGSSPTTRSLSGEAAANSLYPFFGEFGFEENQRLLNMLENNYINGLEWANLSGL